MIRKIRENHYSTKLERVMRTDDLQPEFRLSVLYLIGLPFIVNALLLSSSIQLGEIFLNLGVQSTPLGAWALGIALILFINLVAIVSYTSYRKQIKLVYGIIVSEDECRELDGKLDRLISTKEAEFKNVSKLKYTQLRFSKRDIRYKDYKYAVSISRNMR